MAKDVKPIRNIYCDESCHLRSQSGAMVLGAVMSPASRVREHRDAIRRIKEKHGLKSFCEMKWTGVSPSKFAAYRDLIDYFFDSGDLKFRGLVVKEKDFLNHAAFNQTYDDWYYKMYFVLLNPLVSDQYANRIYLDIKDTRGFRKVQKLHDILCSKEYDFDHSSIARVQEIRSHEVALMSLLDILIGAIAYRQRGLATSEAKLGLIRHIQERSALLLDRSTYLSAQKVNLFFWNPQER